MARIALVFAAVGGFLLIGLVLMGGGHEPAMTGAESLGAELDSGERGNESNPWANLGGANAADMVRSNVADGALVHVGGDLVDADGRAVADATILFWNDGGEVHTAELQASGAFAVADVPPGLWRALVMAPGYADLSQAVEVAAAPPRQRVELVLDEAKFDVRLETPEGYPFNEALREAFPGRQLSVRLIFGREAPGVSIEPGEQAASAKLGTRKRDGSVQLTGLPPVHVSAVFQNHVLATTHVEQPTKEVVLPVSVAPIRALMGSVSCRVFDRDTGQPIVGASVFLHQMGRRTLKDFTGVGGFVQLEHLLPGEWQLDLSAPGYEGARHDVDVTSARLTDLGVVSLSPTATLSGKVFGGSGKPVRAALRAMRYDAEAEGMYMASTRKFRARRDGSFEIPGVGRGMIALVAGAPGHASAKLLVDTTGGPVKDLRINLEEGLEVTVDHRIAESLRYEFELVDSEGVLLQRHEVQSYDWPWKLRAAPSAYTLRVLDKGTVHSTHELEVGDEPISLRLPL